MNVVQEATWAHGPADAEGSTAYGGSGYAVFVCMNVSLVCAAAVLTQWVSAKEAL